MELYEKYFYDPNSPMRQEDFYIMYLQNIIANDKIDDMLKIRPKYQLEMSLKNRPNDIATNFSFELRNGQTQQLKSIKSNYTILFFNNPDCTDCKRVKELFEDNRMPNTKIVAIYCDDDKELWRNTEYDKEWINGYSKKVSDDKIYDLRAIPALYLLDKDKKVILKDATAEMILSYIYQNNN